MIPIQLTISGFLSYRETVELDFSSFELACIAGSNGAGKSSLLDAITWVLFGKARKRDDSLINAQSDAAEVILTFAYEGNIYRVQRSKPRDKTGMLEFYILQRDQLSDTPALDLNSNLWKPLSERTQTDTQARIDQVLRMDYDTFTNASFFLQGKADEFTTQRPSDRKRILGNILGLEVWETYRQRTVERRKEVETQIASLDGRLKEINDELSEEAERKKRLKNLEKDLERLSQARAVQESALESIRKMAASLAEQRKLVDALLRQAQDTKRSLEETRTRAEQRRSEKESYTAILADAEQIEAAYARWQAARQDLERWEEVAGRFREQEKRREGPRDEINAARVRLEQEKRNLLEHQQKVENNRTQVETIQKQLVEVQEAAAKAEAQLARRAELDAELQRARQRQAEAKAENPRLKAEMEDLKERIDQLTKTEGANCPLCGQPLSTEERQKLIESLTAQGKEKGDRYRANLELLRQADQQVQDLERQIAELAAAEAEMLAHAQRKAGLENQLENLVEGIKAWEAQDLQRLQVVQDSLKKENFAPEARARLSQIDAELKDIGYDAAAHDATRRAEQEGRQSEARVRELERARAALAPLERELADLEAQIAKQEKEAHKRLAEHDQAVAGLAAAEAEAPDLHAAQRELLDLQEQENRLRLEVGAAQQKVLVLEDLKGRRKSLDAQRNDCAERVRQYKLLERAFGKDGVPALLIEQALPQIEAKSNEILDRLSAGNMSVRFITQAAYKDKRRDDLRETLDIQISDSAGIRDYEMFSGGEAFRINFAIRLALSEVLAQRAGARLQTLVIDEGFGNQDALGRQRLIEAINMVRSDFAKILVITHIEELKEAFPNRIEVEKTAAGSQVRVI